MKLKLIPLLLAFVVDDVAATATLVSSALQNVLHNTHGSDLYTYPTDFTRGIIPKPLHSHNDYWRDVPFYSGLSYGAVSTEADVWLVNSTLYVGHEESALTDARTLDALYIRPIADTLGRQNPSTRFASAQSRNGVFDSAPGQTLYLWLDVKTDANTTWAAVQAALDSLRAAGWLTTYFAANDSLVPGPVTAIGTGNTRLSDVLGQEGARDIFYDAPLAALPSAAEVPGPAVAPFASANLYAALGHGDMTGAAPPAFDETQLAALRAQVAAAHARGIAARYWDLPAFPIGTRNAVWRTLLDEGVDLLNVDDLAGAVELWQMER